MTHVFVAPHPDDVALSCGGLIASLRELGQNVTILTVFSGDGSAAAGLSEYQREALGFGSKAMWPATEAFNRSAIAADWPTASLVPAWAATEEALEATQAECGRRGQALLAALVLVSPGEHPQRLAGGPAGDRRPVDAGRGLHGRRRRGGCGRRPDGPAARRGRALRLLRRGVGGLSRPARRGLPRLRGRRRAARRRHATTTTRRSSACGRRSIDSSRSGSTSRSASAATSTTSSAATSAPACSRSRGAG